MGLTIISGVMHIPIIDVPQVLTEINTEFGGWFDRLQSVSCLSDEEIFRYDQTYSDYDCLSEQALMNLLFIYISKRDNNYII